MSNLYEIISVTDIDKKKRKVTFADGLCLSLYIGEIRRFSIEKGRFISEEDFYEITKILKKRAKERSLYLLKDSDKTKKQIREKLSMSYYPESIIDETIDFLCRYNYLDDKRYCANYINTYKTSRSIRRITCDLTTKGVPKSIIKEVLEDSENPVIIDNESIITKLLEKKKYDPSIDDYSYKNKIVGHIVRKGFDYDEVIHAMNNYLIR